MSSIFDLADTWNNIATVFTALKMNVTNTNSAAGSKLVDLQVGGTSKFSVGKDGDVTIVNPANTLTIGDGLWSAGTYAGNTYEIKIGYSVATTARIGANGIMVRSGLNIGFGANVEAGCDATFSRVAAGIIKVDNAGSGGGSIVTAAYTVATLPAAATAGAGARAFVTDANSTTFNAAAASGGANKVPVFSDGTSWKIG